MGKLSSLILFILVLCVGIGTLPTCISWLSDKSKLRGEMQSAEYVQQDSNKKAYSITYDLGGGTVENNPTSYGVFTETFTLNNPIKQGCVFTGWTGSNGEQPQRTITICTGSSGDLNFSANFEDGLSMLTNTVENLSMDITFSRSSNGYSLGIGNGALGNFSLDYDNSLTCWVDQRWNIDGYTPEKYLKHYLNPRKDITTLDFSVQQLFEIINENYSTGDKNKTLEINNFFTFNYFNKDDGASYTHTANTTLINITYGYMFKEASVKDGDELHPTTFHTSNNLTVDLSGFSTGPFFNTILDLYSAEGVKYRFTYRYYIRNGQENYRIQDFTNDTDEFYSLSEFDSLTNNLKFYLNDDYYFQFNGIKISEFLKQVYLEARSNHDAYVAESGHTPKGDYDLWNFTGGKLKYYEKDISDNFAIYSNEGIIQNFDITAIFDYGCYRSI